MHNEDFKSPKDIEIKFHRLRYPLLNKDISPLSGFYNPIDNIESSEYSLFNKFKNFDISSNKCTNLENLFSINDNFGRIYISEELEGLITLSNISKSEIIIKDIKITLKICDKAHEYFTFPIETNLHYNSIKLLPLKNFTFKIKFLVDYATKNRIHINFTKKSPEYEKLYSKKFKQKPPLNEKFSTYSIVNGSIEFPGLKKLSFESFDPFAINEKFNNYPNNKSIIEILFLNHVSNPITILDISLYPKDNNNKEKIPLVEDLEDMKCLKYSQNINDSKYLEMQSDEQIKFLFEIENSELYNDTDKFVLNINWLNKYDFKPKIYKYIFNNNLNTYNEYYKITILDKPNGDIFLNQKFQIVINLKIKNMKKNYKINICKDPNKDRELEIVDINISIIELNSENPSNNFILTCKSDILGKVNLPKLKFRLHEEKINTPIENVCEPLVSFNCIENI